VRGVVTVSECLKLVVFFDLLGGCRRCWTSVREGARRRSCVHM